MNNGNWFKDAQTMTVNILTVNVNLGWPIFLNSVAYSQRPWDCPANCPAIYNAVHIKTENHILDLVEDYVFNHIDLSVLDPIYNSIDVRSICNCVLEEKWNTQI